MEFDRAAVTKERAAGAMTGRAGSKKESIRRFARKKRLRILYFQIYSVHLHHQNGLCRDGTGESVAQQVEHNTFNVGVLGSSPSGFTKRELTVNRLSALFVFHTLPRILVLNLKIRPFSGTGYALGYTLGTHWVRIRVRIEPVRPPTAYNTQSNDIQGYMPKEHRL